jgi:hypothetical protein
MDQPSGCGRQETLSKEYKAQKMFPAWEQIIPNVGTSRSQAGNKFCA